MTRLVDLTPTLRPPRDWTVSVTTEVRVRASDKHVAERLARRHAERLGATVITTEARTP